MVPEKLCETPFYQNGDFLQKLCSEIKGLDIRRIKAEVGD
jgi:hypothetical protein